MSKKDFELIAAVLKRARVASLARGFQTGHRRAVCNEHANLFCDALDDTNPRFDRERFLRAAGVWDE